MFSVPGMCCWTGYSFHHSCSRAGYRFLQKCSQKGILFSNSCSQTGLQCIFLILCSQTGCGFLPFFSQTGVFKLRKMLPDRVKITAPQRHTPVHIRTKCPPPPGAGSRYKPMRGLISSKMFIVTLIRRRLSQTCNSFHPCTGKHWIERGTLNQTKECLLKSFLKMVVVQVKPYQICQSLHSRAQILGPKGGCPNLEPKRWV